MIIPPPEVTAARSPGGEKHARARRSSRWALPTLALAVAFAAGIACVTFFWNALIGFATFAPDVPGIDFLTYAGCFERHTNLILLPPNGDPDAIHPQADQSSALWAAAAVHNQLRRFALERVGRTDCAPNADVGAAFAAITTAVGESGRVSVLPRGPDGRSALIFRIALKEDTQLKQVVATACEALRTNDLLPAFSLLAGVGSPLSPLDRQTCPERSLASR